MEQNSRGVVNVFSGQVATPEQSVDMMTFRETGIKAYRQYISTRLLEVPSHANAPLQRQKLLTMSSTKAKKKRMTPREQADKNTSSNVCNIGCSGVMKRIYHSILVRSNTAYYQGH